MNQGTKVQVTAQPNGDLTLENEDGTITIRTDGTIAISTLAPLHLTGHTVGKFDGLPGNLYVQATQILGVRGRRR